MPTLDQPWTQADYDSAYDMPGEEDGYPGTRQEVRLAYHRASVLPVLIAHWSRLAPALALTSSDGVIVVGAGFGWGSEAAQFAIPGLAVAGTDISAFIQAEKGTSEEPDLRARITAVGLNPDSGRGAQLLARYHDGGVRGRTEIADEHLSNAGSRNRVRGFIGGPPTWVVSEDVLTCLSDPQVLVLAQRMESLNPTGGIVHTVTPLEPDWAERAMQDSGYNWKSLTDWRALFDANGLGAHRLIASTCSGGFV